MSKSSKYAHVIDGEVVNIIVAEKDYIDSLSNSNEYIEDSAEKYKNTAEIGGLFDYNLNCFRAKNSPFPSWKLNTDTCRFEPPIPRPEIDVDNYIDWGWNEDELCWEQHQWVGVGDESNTKLVKTGIIVK